MDEAFQIRVDIPMPDGGITGRVYVRTDERRAYERSHYAANKGRIRARKNADYERNRDKELKRGAKYRAENPEKVKASTKTWAVNNREKRAEIVRNYINGREAIDPEFKLLRSIRSRLRTALKKNTKSGKTLDLLGCTIQELRAYIEGLWLPGMNWENRSFRGWHLDHKRPLASFDLTDPDQLKAACHYTNLQPLWWQKNLEKGDRYHGC